LVHWLFGPRLLRLLDEEAVVRCLVVLVRTSGALTTWREKCSLASVLERTAGRLTSRSIGRGTL
jgi:hypothetical protein